MTLHSKHVFLFPFRWDINYVGKRHGESTYDSRTSLAAFDSILSNDSFWDEITKFDIDTSTQYNTRTYFYPFVRRAVFPPQSDSVDNSSRLLRQYQYPVGEKAFYQIVIRKVDEKKSLVEQKVVYHYDETFNLDLKAITLTIYEVGIGILSFSLENTEYDNPEVILHINDYGRRLYPQFLGDGFALKNSQNSFLAYQINLFNQTGSLNIRTDFSNNYTKEPDYLPGHILTLLNQNNINRVKFAVSRPINQADWKTTEKVDFIRIEPVLDDRMYVLCWYGNKIANTIAGVNEVTQEYSEIQAHANFWYRFIYVDNSDISSTNPLFIKELIKQTTYTRWAGGYKTLYGVSRYSFVLLTAPPDNPEWFDFGKSVLSIHLTTIYNQLVTLCLVQRASLLRFSGEVAFISRQLRGNDITLSLIGEQVQQLNRSYLEFDNRIYFSEVTAQEQGIELYDRVQCMMRIAQLAQNVKNEITNLHDYLQTATSESERVAINRLTIIGGLFGLAGFIISYLGLTFFDFAKLPRQQIQYWVVISCISLLSLLTLFLLEPAWLKRVIKKDWRTNKVRSGILAITAFCLGLFIIIPAFKSCQSSFPEQSKQPAIDSTAIKHLDSLRDEIRLLQQVKPTTPSLNKPDSLSQ